MPILYSVISRSTTVLAKYAECVGNFAEVTEQIMVKIGKDNHKQTYQHGSYLINYIAQDNVIYMCITDDVSILHFNMFFYFEFLSNREVFSILFIFKTNIWI